MMTKRQAPFKANAINYPMRLLNGEIRMDAFDEVFPGDTVRYEFISMDKASYQYFDKISQISQEGGGGNVVPFNPIGNFGPEVLGFFGIYTSGYRTVVIP